MSKRGGDATEGAATNASTTNADREEFLLQARTLDPKATLRHFVDGWRVQRWNEPIPPERAAEVLKESSGDAVALAEDRVVRPHLEATVQGIPLGVALDDSRLTRVVYQFAPVRLSASAVREELRQRSEWDAASALRNVVDAIGSGPPGNAARLARETLDDSGIAARARAAALAKCASLGVVLQDTELDALVRSEASARAAAARELAAAAVKYLIATRGRAAARNFVLLRAGSISEDVDRGFLDAARNEGEWVFDEVDLPRLPLRLRPLVSEHLRPFRRPTSASNADVLLAGMAEGGRRPVAKLLADTSVTLAANEDDFSAEELERLQQTSRRLPEPVPWQELAYALRREAPELRGLVSVAITQSDRSNTRNTYAVPALRLIHMRGVLAAQSLQDARREPIVPMVRQIVEVLSGDDTLTFGSRFSYLRSARADNRSFFRRLAEEFGEAFAILFLEDVIDLDLSRLTRIPEADDSTPDFAAMTRSGERIVIEVKGATKWSYFTSSRTKGLKQLGKVGPARRRRAQGRFPRDRAFLSRLFLAERNDERESLLEVIDPPVDFDAIFDPDWKERAVREHTSATLHFAGFSRLAGWVAQPPHLRRSPFGRSVEEGRTSFFETTGRSWIGTTLPLADAAGLFGLPTNDVLDELVLFRGIDATIHRAAMDGEVRTPQPKETTARDARDDGVGVIDGPRGGHVAYSVLSNGSMLGIGARGVFK